MPLFLVQDDERPLYVVAENFTKALEAWREIICEENDATMEQLDDATGIQKLCDDDELIVNGKLMAPLGA